MYGGNAMPSAKLKEYLDSENIKYVSIMHSRAYTAQETAETAHIPGKELAKTVMVKLDGELAMAVLPALDRVDFDLLKGVANAKDASLADENDFNSMFPESEAGAMPPFGNIYGMDVYVEESLSEDREIAFNAGSHSELIKLSYNDFERLVKPKIARISNKYSS